ncbi:hypothetical protein BT69DRAFT_1264076 [Atractiella rhizophila]|nr:hypothetical protein BT69DRAFT_1264076 [Atractiella rhizophila]
MLLRLRNLQYRRFSAFSPARTVTLGIVAEHRDRVWERRVPLVPKDVKKLLDEHDDLQVLVQPSAKRCYTEKEYEEAGATIEEDLDKANIILGVKEIPREALRSGKTYAFFSHTHKGQDYNLGLLDTMIKTGSRYIDWELLTDEKGQRTTAFGWYAGAVGAIDGLSNFGEMALLGLGIQTPFLHLPRPYSYPTLSSLTAHLRSLRPLSIPPSLRPFVITVLGRGRVSQGAKAMLDELGVTWVRKGDLGRLKGDKIYACQLELEEYLRNGEGKFSREEYNEHPERYHSLFAEEVAPYTTVLLNGSFWAPRFPRVLSEGDLQTLQATRRGARGLLSIIDVSCDFNGGIEVVRRATTIDKPVYYYDRGVETGVPTPSATQVFSIEILPTELPKDSSTFFSDKVTPYIDALIRKKPRDDLREALERATLVRGGRIGERHDRKGELGRKVTAHVNQRKDRVLILGSGLVAKPAAKLVVEAGAKLVVASNDLKGAENMVADLTGAQPAYLDVTDLNAVDELVQGSDVVIRHGFHLYSLLPAPMHPKIVDLCLKRGKHFVSASYTGEEVQKMDARAKEKDCIVLTEMGLDPGIDHMSAMRLFEDAKRRDLELESFISFCGGLPAPEHSNVPFSYKFSWAPKSALLAAFNEAKYRLRGQAITVPGSRLLQSAFPNMNISQFSFEGLPNRNSLHYLDTYQLQPNLPTMLRGTLRYRGFSRLLRGFQSAGLLNQVALQRSSSGWKDFFAACLGVSDSKQARQVLMERVEGDEALADEVEAAFDWLVSHSNLQYVHNQQPLDTTALLMQQALKYQPGERDLCFLHHEVGVKDRQGKRSSLTSTLVAYGDEAAPAMAKTVGETAALGALLILQGRITGRGVITPTSSEVWTAALPQLESRNIRCLEQESSHCLLHDSL